MVSQFVTNVSKAASVNNEINEMVATVKKTSLLFSLNWSHCTETLQWVASLCAKIGSDRFCCNDQSHCNETCEVFDCKII